MERLKIVILPHGHVIVGRVSREDEGLIVHDCSVIRRWGTTRGIGQLALEGPELATLDYEGTARVPHILAVIRLIDCDEKKWQDYPACAKKK